MNLLIMAAIIIADKYSDIKIAIVSVPNTAVATVCASSRLSYMISPIRHITSAVVLNKDKVTS
jgi:hypothetical protein